ncbi:MAG: NUDIX domain-containing protein [Chroococcidiopsidaceae cyanobacterium CP_BM_ER_R8_30]|nr:NUDIX domain-containing protein [Chroococcidiopsidaceae cyanobacterium CP_BM_ER_R8_30]
MARKFTLRKHQISVFAIIRDDAGRVLLSRRTDNGWFNLPGGKVEPGESVVEALIREVWEETGLIVQVDGLIGLYTKRKKLGFTVTFGARIVAGRLRPSDEADRHEWVAPSRLNQLKVLPRHLERTHDALRNASSVILENLHHFSLTA